MVVIYATFPAKVLVILNCYILFTFTINEQSERLKKDELIKISIRLERKSERLRK